MAKKGFSRYLQNLNYEPIFGLSVLWGQKKKKKKKKKKSPTYDRETEPTGSATSCYHSEIWYTYSYSTCKALCKVSG